MTEVFIIPSQLITGYPESAGLIMSVCGKKLRSKQFNINCFSQTTIGTKYSKTTKYLCRSFKNIKRSSLFCSIRIINSLQATQKQAQALAFKIFSEIKPTFSFLFQCHNSILHFIIPDQVQLLLSNDRQCSCFSFSSCPCLQLNCKSGSSGFSS